MMLHSCCTHTEAQTHGAPEEPAAEPAAAAEDPDLLQKPHGELLVRDAALGRAHIFSALIGHVEVDPHEDVLLRSRRAAQKQKREAACSDQTLTKHSAASSMMPSWKRRWPWKLWARALRSESDGSTSSLLCWNSAKMSWNTHSKVSGRRRRRRRGSRAHLQSAEHARVLQTLVIAQPTEAPAEDVQVPENLRDGAHVRCEPSRAEVTGEKVARGRVSWGALRAYPRERWLPMSEGRVSRPGGRPQPPSCPPPAPICCSLPVCDLSTGCSDTSHLRFLPRLQNIP